MTFGPGGATLQQGASRVHAPLVHVDAGLHVVQGVDYDILLGEELVGVYVCLRAIVYCTAREDKRVVTLRIAGA